MKIIRFILVIVPLLFAVAAHADDPQTDMKVHCQEMMAKHEQVMTKMKEMDAKLDQLIADMNSAKGNQKVDAMAAVITEMAGQRKAMMSMMHEMMPMMGHPAMGDMKDGMMQGCPMMKGGAMEGCTMGDDCPMMKGGDCPMMKQGEEQKESH